MFENDFEIIKSLTEIQSCSGNENKIREFIKRIVEPYCDRTEIDIFGNLFCFLGGTLGSGKNKLKVLLDAHMDEKP
ncbi:MAG: hypothetical protein ACTSQJ_06615 [Promethearchaeota archaeon]